MHGSEGGRAHNGDVSPQDPYAPETPAEPQGMTILPGESVPGFAHPTADPTPVGVSDSPLLSNGDQVPEDADPLIPGMGDESGSENDDSDGAAVGKKRNRIIATGAGAGLLAAGAAAVLAISGEDEQPAPVWPTATASLSPATTLALPSSTTLLKPGATDPAGAALSRARTTLDLTDDSASYLIAGSGKPAKTVKTNGKGGKRGKPKTKVVRPAIPPTTASVWISGNSTASDYIGQASTLAAKSAKVLDPNRPVVPMPISATPEVGVACVGIPASPLTKYRQVCSWSDSRSRGTMLTRGTKATKVIGAQAISQLRAALTP